MGATTLIFAYITGYICEVLGNPIYCMYMNCEAEINV